MNFFLMITMMMAPWVAGDISDKAPEKMPQAAIQPATFVPVGAPFSSLTSVPLPKKFAELQVKVDQWFSEWKKLYAVGWVDWEITDVFLPENATFYVTSGPSTVQRTLDTGTVKSKSLGVATSQLWVYVKPEWKAFSLPFLTEKIDKQGSCESYLSVNLESPKLYAVLADGPREIPVPTNFDRVFTSRNGNWIAVSVKAGLVYFGDVNNYEMRTNGKIDFNFLEQKSVGLSMTLVEAVWSSDGSRAVFFNSMYGVQGDTIQINFSKQSHEKIIERDNISSAIINLSNHFLSVSPGNGSISSVLRLTAAGKSEVIVKINNGNKIAAFAIAPDGRSLYGRIKDKMWRSGWMPGYNGNLGLAHISESGEIKLQDLIDSPNRFIGWVANSEE